MKICSQPTGKSLISISISTVALGNSPSNIKVSLETLVQKVRGATRARQHPNSFAPSQEMNIGDQISNKRLLAYDRFIAVLKKVSVLVKGGNRGRSCGCGSDVRMNP